MNIEYFIIIYTNILAVYCQILILSFRIYLFELCYSTGPLGPTGVEMAINNIMLLPRTSDQFIVCSRTNVVTVMNLQGMTVKSYSSG